MPVVGVNGISINYEAHGGEGSAPLVLAHGYTASLEMWRAFLPALSARYRTVVYDTRGHGKSSAPAEMERYSLARDYVGDQAALMDALGIERAIVGGLSMGGMIAQEFALQHPERVRALLLFDTGPGTGMASDPSMRQRMEQFRSMMAQMARTKGMSAVVELMRQSPMWASRVAQNVPDAVRRHVEGMMTMSVDGYLGGAKAMQDWAGTVERLHEIRVPTLVLVGEHDNLLRASRVIHERIAGSRFVLVRGAGHGTSMWRPEAFLRATLEFLDAVERGDEVGGECEV